MCLIITAYKIHPRYPLIIAANRDEYYRRPSAPAEFWPETPSVLAGKDLDQLGTWMGITTAGRIAAITNYRDPAALRSDAKSRGALVRNFLCGSQTPTDYLHDVNQAKNDYNGFNLLVGDTSGLFYYSNRTGEIQEVTTGIHGLSNHLLDTPWPKVVKAKSEMAKFMNYKQNDIAEKLFSFLGDSSRPPDEMLPQTGVSLEFERLLSSIFISGQDYGTRCSTVILVDHSGHVQFIERTVPVFKEAAYQFKIQA